MKKWIALAAAALLCVSLTACGGEKNPEHEYILSLLETGDYDMAILVIEGIRERELGPRQTEPAPTESTEAPAQEPVLSDAVSTVCDTVNQYLSEKSGDVKLAMPLTVTHAMDCRIGNYDGRKSTAHFLLINIQTDVICGDIIYDSLQLLLDLDAQKIYSSPEIDWVLLEASNGEPTDHETFCNIALNSYYSFILQDNDTIWNDSEIHEEYTAADIAAVNDILN